MSLFLYVLLSLTLIKTVSSRRINYPFKNIILFAFILRIVVMLLFLTSKSEDLATFLRDGQYLLDKSSKYEASYFPFIGYLGALALLAKNYLHPYLLLKIVFNIFDTLILFPLYFLSRKNLQSVLIYALNPISVIVTNVHGQMDAITMFFFLLGIQLFFKNRISASFLTIAFAIFTKPWPALFILPLIRQTRNKLMPTLFLILPLVLTYIHSLFFPPKFLDILTQVKNYRGIFAVWGISQILTYLTQSNLGPFFESWLRRIFLAGFTLFQLILNRKEILKAILLSMLFLFIFSPTFGIQWLFWIVPFVILVKPKSWRIFILLTTIYLAAGLAWDAYPNLRFISLWHSAITIAGLFCWLFIIYLFFAIIKLPPQ